MANGPKAAIALGVLAIAGSGAYALYDRGKVAKRGCGSKYHSLAVTVSGQTMDDPYGWVGTSQDYSEWVDLADKLSAIAIEHHAELGRVECEKTGGTNCSDVEAATGGAYPRWNALVDQKNRLVEKLDNLDSVWTTLDIPTGVSRAKAVVTDALCLLERADDGIKFYGEVVPTIPGLGHAATKSLPWYAWTGIAGLGVVSVGIVLGALLPAPAGASTTVVIRDEDKPARKSA